MMRYHFASYSPTLSYGNIEESWFYNLSYMKKMNDKPGHIRPVKGFYEKLNALMFVPQQELSREQAYWLPANERAMFVPPRCEFAYRRFLDLHAIGNKTQKFLNLKLTLSNRNRNLDARSDIMKAMLNVGTTEEFCDQRALETTEYIERYITSLRIQTNGLT
ncbi:hypothetical protein Tco_0793923 [Tanacetum coccineum]